MCPPSLQEKVAAASSKSSSSRRMTATASGGRGGAGAGGGGGGGGVSLETVGEPRAVVVYDTASHALPLLVDLVLAGSGGSAIKLVVYVR